MTPTETAAAARPSRQDREAFESSLLQSLGQASWQEIPQPHPFYEERGYRTFAAHHDGETFSLTMNPYCNGSSYQLLVVDDAAGAETFHHHVDVSKWSTHPLAELWNMAVRADGVELDSAVMPPADPGSASEEAIE